MTSYTATDHQNIHITIFIQKNHKFSHSLGVEARTTIIIKFNKNILFCIFIAYNLTKRIFIYITLNSLYKPLHSISIEV